MKIFIGIAAVMAGALAGCGGARAPLESESQTTVVASNAARAPAQTPTRSLAARSKAAGRAAPWSEPSRGGQWLLRSPAPPKVVAQRRSDIPEAVQDAAAARRNASANPRRGERWIDSARIGLLQGAPEGGQFLDAPQTRALARGEPPESCPALSVAVGGSADAAARDAFNQCFDILDGRADCGCRLMAQGGQLLARENDFAYATGVTAVMYGRDYDGALVVAEERPDPTLPQMRRLWLLSPTGATAMAQLASDGRAALLFGQTGARYDGVHRADGLRRGRIARRLFLRGADGDQLTILVGFEPEELTERGEDLRVWTER